MRKALNKVSVVVYIADKDLDIVNRLQYSLVLDYLNLLQLYLNALSGYQVAQVRCFFLEEATLRDLSIQLVLLQLLEDLVNVADVLLARFRVDQDVIQVDYVGNVNKTSQCAINIRLERYQGIRKPKRDYYILEVAVPSLEYCLLLVAFPDIDTIVRVAQIEGRKLVRV